MDLYKKKEKNKRNRKKDLREKTKQKRSNKNNALDSLVSWSMKNAMNCDKRYELYTVKYRVLNA